MEQMSVAVKVKNVESGNNNTQSFTCSGEIYDEFCPEKRQFDSAALAVEVIPAAPLEHPMAGFVNIFSILLFLFFSFLLKFRELIKQLNKRGV